MMYSKERYMKNNPHIGASGVPITLVSCPDPTHRGKRLTQACESLALQNCSDLIIVGCEYQVLYSNKCHSLVTLKIWSESRNSGSCHQTLFLMRGCGLAMRLQQPLPKMVTTDTSQGFTIHALINTLKDRA